MSIAPCCSGVVPLKHCRKGSQTGGVEHVFVEKLLSTPRWSALGASTWSSTMCLNITDREKLQEWSNAFHDQNAARYTSAIISILSTLGSLCIILTYCAMPSMRKVTSRQLLLFLAIADLLSSVSTGVGSLVFFNTYTACRVQAFITVVATLSSVLWSTCMAVYIYLCVSKERMELAKKLRTPFHIICWGIPLLVAIVALLEGALGAPGYWATIGWCWIDLEPKQPSNWKCDDAQMLWMLLSLKGWEVVSYFIIPFMYLQAKRDIKKAVSMHMGDRIVGLSMFQNVKCRE